eukprot:5515669-Amphidinium_carterae.2
MLRGLVCSGVGVRGASSSSGPLSEGEYPDPLSLVELLEGSLAEGCGKLEVVEAASSSDEQVCAMGTSCAVLGLKPNCLSLNKCSVRTSLRV